MRTVSGLVFLALLSGCGAPRFVGGPGVTQVADLGAVPAPISPSTFEARVPYRIGPFDKLKYVLVGLEPPDGEAVVDTSGNISIPLAGQVHVGGLTPGEAEAAIVAALRQRYVREPIVSLNVIDIKSQTVTVEGQVKEPGLYPVTGQTTLLRAIASAKGLTEFAQTKQVVVLRTGNGQGDAALYNLDAIRSGAYADPHINPGDLVVIDESRARRYFRDVLTATPALLSPLIILLTR